MPRTFIAQPGGHLSSAPQKIHDRRAIRGLFAWFGVRKAWGFLTQRGRGSSREIRCLGSRWVTTSGARERAVTVAMNYPCGWPSLSEQSASRRSRHAYRRSSNPRSLGSPPVVLGEWSETHGAL